VLQFLDPIANQQFFYNIRTGESQWDRPPNFVATAKRIRRKKKSKT